MLQAMRGCLRGAGNKMGEPIRRQVTATLEELLSCNEDSTRTTAAACLGTMCMCVSHETLAVLLGSQILDTDASEAWTLRHGRAVSLYVALKEATDKMLHEEFQARLLDSILTHMAADRIPLCASGVRAAGYYLKYQVDNETTLCQQLVSALTKAMKHESNDVKQLAAQVVTFITKGTTSALDMSVIVSLVPMLVNGTKEKNTVVRTSSETALVSLLRMRHGDDTLHSCLNAMESGMKDSLNDVAAKVLRRVVSLPESVPEDIDDTVLV